MQVDPLQHRLLNWPEVSHFHTFLVARALAVCDFLEQHLLEDDFGRGDIKKTLKTHHQVPMWTGYSLTTQLRPWSLGGDFVMRAAGVLHHAR